MRNISKTLILALAALFVFQACGRKEAPAPKEITCIEDLKGLDVGVVMGSIGDIALTTEYPEIRLHRYNNPATLFQAMEMGRLDAAYNDGTMAMDSHFAAKGMVTRFSGPFGGGVGFGFNMENVELCDQFNKFLAEINSNGTFDAIMARWIVPDADKVRMPDMLGQNTEAEPLDIGILGGNVPFSFVNADGFAGIEPELLTRFAASIGRKVVFHEYEVGALMASIMTGKVDIISAFLYKTEERAKSILFSDTYYTCPMICFTCEAEGIEKPGFFKRIGQSFYNNIIAEKRYELIWEGLLATLLIALLSIIFGTIIGALMCWRAISGNSRIWEGILKVYGAIMHGVPLLVILMLMFYVVFSSTSVSAVVVSIVTFTIYFSYACCEIFKTGIEGISKGQMEAARSLGMSRIQAFRLVILPQAVRNILPFYESEAVTLLKETCLVGFIAVVDLTKATDIIQSRTYDAFFPLLFAALIYFMLAWLLGLALGKLISKRQSR